MKVSIHRSSPTESPVILWHVVVCVAVALLAAACGVQAAQKSGPAPAPKAKPASPTPKPAHVAVVTPNQLGALIGSNLGKVVVVNFWATWCPPCVHELPQFAKFYTHDKGKNVAFISVSVNSQDVLKNGEMDAFLRKHRLPFPIRLVAVHDPNALFGVLKTDWSGDLPATFIFGRDGKLAKAIKGEETTEPALAHIVNNLLGAKANN